MDEEMLLDENKTITTVGKKLSLNFSDKDEKENAKFNDARLVDILRNYPLLYNKSLESYGDPDYTQWMWGEIASEMNDAHRKTTMNLPFNWTTCRNQWEVVKRALRYLSNPAANSFRYPKQFRECLEFFQNYIRDRKEPPHTDRSQDLFVNYTDLLDQLAFEKQLLLEKEVLDEILSSELEFCAPLMDPETVESQAREEFGKVIGLLMPEVNVRVVHNELSTEPESELMLLEELVQKPEGTQDHVQQPVREVAVPAETRDTKLGVALHRGVSQIDYKNIASLPNKRLSMEAAHSHENIQYSVQEVITEDDLQGVIVEDIIEEDEMQQSGILVTEGQEVILQECVYQDDAMQEDLIEEVISEDAAKDIPALDIDGSFETQVNRLDFDGVLNEMLE